MSNDLYTFLIVFIILTVIVFVFIRIAVRLRKHGGSMVTTMHASTYEFLGKDKREAAEEVVEIKANKKMEEEASNKPKDDL